MDAFDAAVGVRASGADEALAGAESVNGGAEVLEVVAAVMAMDTDTVVVSHFVAINAVIGVCLGDDRIVIRSLDNTSVTVVETTPASS